MSGINSISNWLCHQQLCRSRIKRGLGTLGQRFFKKYKLPIHRPWLNFCKTLEIVDMFVELSSEVLQKSTLGKCGEKSSKDISNEMLYVLDKFLALLCDDFVGSEERNQGHGTICPLEDAL